MHTETVIAKYTLTDSMLVEAVVVIAALSVLAISKRVKGVAVKWVPL